MKRLLAVPCVAVAILAGCFDQPRDAQSPTASGQQLEALKLERFQAGLHRGQEAPPPLAGTFDLPSLKSAPAHRVLVDSATITPPSLNLTLGAGECAPVHKSVFLPGTSISRADILFAVDLTGSMGEELTQLQIEIQNVADQLALLIDDPAFGVVSYMDYPAFYNFCDYASEYGTPACSDVPYALNQPINTDVNLSKNAVGALSLGCGSDGPESYARVLYETYSDAAIAWRAGSRRIVVNFGDNIPHDCNIGACLSMAAGSTGVDPGRDGIAGTADDLPILTVLAGMAANNTTLIHINSEGVFPSLTQDLWSCWSTITGPGGVSVQINSDGSIPGGIDLAQLIFDRVGLVAQTCGEVKLVPTAGFESWVQGLTPASYLDVELPATLEFDLDLCVPVGTAPGTYIFEICADCDGGLEVCETDTITVRPAESPGFFTGGGHLPGAKPNSHTFGFNAGFHGSDPGPNGNLEFNDHDLKKKVHSLSVDEFTVDGDCCTFSGDCRVNNVAGYTYEVTACDHAEPGKDVDSFTIRVWDSGGELVCSAGGLLGGGNIQKHAATGPPPAPGRVGRGSVGN